MTATLAIAAAIMSAPITYPETRRQDLVETLHGVPVADPYRWLEDANSPETKAWVEAQNKVTFGFLEGLPDRAKIKARLEEVWNYTRYGMPTRVGSRYVFSRNDGLQNQSPLYVADSLRGKPRLLLDPNTLSKDGTVALSGTSFSECGRYMAYSTSSGGSDWQEWRVRRLEDGKDLDDRIEWAKFTGAAWTESPDRPLGFYYSRYDAPKEGEALQGVNKNQKLYFHKLGTPQSEDVLIYARPDQPDWGFGAGESEDGRYLVISVWQGTDRNNRIFYKDLRLGMESEAIPLFDKGDASYSVLGNDGPLWYIQTDKDAPNGRVVAVDIRRPQPENWRVVIPEAKEALQSVSLLGDRLYANYSQDAHTVIRVFGTDGKRFSDVRLPGLGTAGGFGGRRDDPETFFAYTSFDTPNTLFRYDLKTRRATVWRKPEVKIALDDIEVNQVFYPSKDGTKIPLFIVHKKGLKKNGQNPTLLYGYGGFGAGMSPFFSVTVGQWLEMGGVYALACIRGGNEYGNAWHDAGRLKNKQNVFDDFIAAAEYLQKEGYTSPAKTAIEGGSNGGLLVGAVLNQRPDLFGAAVPAVGVMDMLRFHRFTIGWAWKSDYGDPEVKEDFEVLRKYSPLHNLRPQRYPAVLVTTGDHDDRVVPAHSYKYIAELQRVQQGEAPVLIRIETRAGHGAGKPVAKQIEEVADVHAFLWWALHRSPR